MQAVLNYNQAVRVLSASSHRKGAVLQNQGGSDIVWAASKEEAFVGRGGITLGPADRIVLDAHRCECWATVNSPAYTTNNNYSGLAVQEWT